MKTQLPTYSIDDHRISHPFSLMTHNLHISKFVSVNSLSHQVLNSLNHCRICRPYPSTMDNARKRLRNVDEDDESGILASLSRPISPPRKRFRQVAIQKSPWQLTRIRDLPEEVNKDTITLEDILGDPLICECWQFNFLHDIPFVMNAFDERVRHLVQVHVVHGFWKRNDLSRIVLSVGHLFLPHFCISYAPTSIWCSLSAFFFYTPLSLERIYS
jgi:MATE family multidrug resistance protein